MARDDDDDRGAIRRKYREDDDDRPRKRGARDDDDDDKERGKRDARGDEKDDDGKSPRPMPMRLVGAIIAALTWGFLTLYFSCFQSGHAVVNEIQYQKVRAKMEEERRKFEDQQKAFGGFKMKIDRPAEPSRSLYYAIVGVKAVLMFLALVLVAGGIVLLMRKSFGKYIVMAAPVLMLLLELLGFAVCLFLSDWTFIASHNSDFFINMFFSLVVGGTIVFLLLNRDVSNALT